MRILFTAPENAFGGFYGLIRSELPQHHYEVTGRFEVDTLKGFHVLIPTMTTVTREMLEEADELRLVQQCGAGIDMVDLEAARDLNIWVANVPADSSGNADSVAEVGIYLMVGLARDFRNMARSMANRKMGQPQGRALMGKTVGLVGLGGIGKALVKRLRPFDVHIIGIKRDDPQKAKEELGLQWAGGPEDLPELLRRADFVVLCLPATKETLNMIDGKAFSHMKQSAFLINLARGSLVDRDALEEALASQKIAGAGLDVFWEEPPDPEDPLFSYNVLVTPHIAGATDVSMKGIVAAVAENLNRLEKNEEPLNLKYP